MGSIGSRSTVGGSLQLRLLAGFELRTARDVVDVPFTAQRLLAFVALHERPVHRSFVAGSLWADTTDARAAANLRSALWRLRQPGLDVLAVTTTHLALAAGVVVDVRESMQHAQRLVRGETAVVSADVEDSLRGDLLPDWYDDWVLLERERFRQLRLHALEQLCSCYAAAAEYGRAIDAGLAAVAAEPLRESAHRGLIRAHLAEGNRSEAVRQYDLCRRLLDEEFGASPSPELQTLADNAHL